MLIGPEATFRDALKVINATDSGIGAIVDPDRRRTNRHSTHPEHGGGDVDEG